MIGDLKKKGVSVLVDSRGAILREAVEAGADWIKCNLGEAEETTGMKGVEGCIGKLVGSGTTGVLVTLGKEGMAVEVNGASFLIPAPKVKVRDATGSGDVVTAEVDMEQEVMRFFINGKPQGDRPVPGIKRLTLVPAVVLGSNAGGHYTRLAIGLPAVSRFDRKRQHKSMEVKDDDRTAHSSARWCSILADHPGVSRGGVLRFAVRLEGDGGAAIGFGGLTACTGELGAPKRLFC
jgi:hypothetical protein